MVAIIPVVAKRLPIPIALIGRTAPDVSEVGDAVAEGVEAGPEPA